MLTNRIVEIKASLTIELRTSWHYTCYTMLCDEGRQFSFNVREIVPIAIWFCGNSKLQAKSFGYVLETSVHANCTNQVAMPQIY